MPGNPTKKILKIESNNNNYLDKIDECWYFYDYDPSDRGHTRIRKLLYAKA